MIVELVFSACLLSGDRHCQKVTLPAGEGASVETCLKTAHDRALDWQAEHAEYMVVGWQCKSREEAGAPAGGDGKPDE